MSFKFGAHLKVRRDFEGSKFNLRWPHHLMFLPLTGFDSFINQNSNVVAGEFGYELEATF